MKKLLFLSFFSIFITCQKNQDRREKEIDKLIEKARKMSDPSNPDRNMNAVTALYQYIEKKSEDTGYRKGTMISCKYLTAHYLNFIEDPKKSLEYSYKTENIAHELKDEDVLAQVHEFRSGAYLDLGFNKEAYTELQKAIDYYKRKKQHFRLHRAYQILTIYHEKTKAPQDTLSYYMNKALQELEAVQDNDSDLPYPSSKYYQLSRIHMNMGLFYTGLYQPQQPQLAEKHLLTSLKILKDNKLEDFTSRLFILNALSRFYENQQQPGIAIPYAEEALKLEKRATQISERLISYMVLANSYETLKNKDSTLKYTKLYSNLSDSISFIQKKEAGNTLLKISSQKEKNYRDNTKKIIITAVSSILILMIAGWLYIKKRNRQIKSNYKKLVEKLNTSPSGNKKTETKLPIVMQISEETLNSIISKLEKFESSDKFLKKNINLSSLAHSLNTNQRYLTEIIKIHRGKSFSNYINGLKIEHITRKLYENPQYREYKISYLAEECGFASHQAFITVFKKETGVTPSYFIENLKNQDDKPLKS